MLKRTVRNKMSLKLRITMLVGSVLVVIAGMFTWFSIMNGNMHFQKLELMRRSTDVFDGEFKSAPSVGTSPQIMYGSNLTATATATAVAISEVKMGFSLTSIYIMIGLIIVGLLITYFVVGKALEPLTKLSDTIADIGEHNLEKQELIEQAHFSGEITTLTNSFNAMLSRMQSAFAQQKQFAMNAAHELKTPLATMKTSLQVLDIDKPDMDDYKDNSEVMAVSVDHLIELVQNLLLTSSSMTEHNMHEEVYLDKIVENCLQGLQCQIIDKELQVDVKVQSCQMQGNPLLLPSVVQNLIENAIKYSDQNGLIEVEVLVSDHHDTATLTVSDCGIGIDSKSLPYIFDAFYRADKSRSKEIAGNGLGLSIVKNIVEKHGGTIKIDSVLEKGTVATVQFPL